VEAPSEIQQQPLAPGARLLRFGCCGCVCAVESGPELSPAAWIAASRGIMPLAAAMAGANRVVFNIARREKVLMASSLGSGGQPHPCPAAWFQSQFVV